MTQQPNTERKFDNFDAFADDYRAIHTENIKITGADSDYFSEHRVLEVKRRLQARGYDLTLPLRILDIGCGDGNADRFFVQHLPAVRCEGIDITEPVVASAQMRNLPHCNFRVYDGEHIPFAEGSFDIVFWANILHHVERRYHAGLYAEALRVTRPGGLLFNFEHNPWNPVTRKIVKDCPFDTDAVLLPPPYHRQLALGAGFAQAAVRFTLFFPRFAVFKPLLGLEKHLHALPLGGQYYIEATK